MAIQNFFSLKSSMGPLTIKIICVISQTQNNKVYNFLYKYLVGKVYHVLSRNNVGKKSRSKN